MTAVYSDSRCEPSPTLAELLQYSPETLLDKTVPKWREMKATPLLDPSMLVVDKPVRKNMQLVCKQCQRTFEHPEHKVTCSTQCLRELHKGAQFGDRIVNLMYMKLRTLVMRDGMWE